MASHTVKLLLVSFLHVCINGSEGRVSLSYRRSGPRMCREVCKDLVQLLAFVEFRCNQIPANHVKRTQNTTTEYAYVCLKNAKTLNGSTFLTSGLAKYSKDDRQFSPQVEMGSQSKWTAHHIYCHNLMKACRSGNVGSFKRILSEREEEVTCRSRKTGLTPISTAARHGKVKIFKTLFRKGWSVFVVDNRNNTLLHTACKGGSVEIVQELVKSGKYSRERRGYYGWTPLIIAALYDHVALFDMLVNEGCDLSAVDDTKSNVLHCACAKCNAEMVKHILSLKICDVEAVDVSGWTPIMVAAMCANTTVFDILVNEGCILYGVDKDNCNILHLACADGNEDVVSRILELELFDINCKGFYGRTPVMIAARYGHKNVVELLYTKDCNLKAHDNEHNTILHIACEGGNIDVVKYIIKLGVLEWDQQNDFGKTPLQMAKPTVYPLLKALQ